MKRPILFLLLFVAIVGCKKEENAPTPANSNPGTPTTTSVSAVPSSFTQKLLIEEFTGAWCGNCPRGTKEITDALDKYQNLIAVAIHNDDYMDAGISITWANEFHHMFFPSFMINRNNSEYCIPGTLEFGQCPIMR